VIKNSYNNNSFPVIGIGEGGYAFFGKRNLYVGWPHGWHGTGTDTKVVDGADNIWSTPNNLSVSTDNTVTCYTGAPGIVEVYLNPVPAGLVIYGYSPDESNHYSLVKQGIYFLWGFNNSPLTMTTDGENLFMNVVENVMP
jgi:hypothetical protein